MTTTAYGDTIAPPIIRVNNAPDPKALLLSMQQKEYDTFTSDYLPLLQQYQDEMSSRRSDYTQAATTEAKNLSALQQNTQGLKRDSLGTALTADQSENRGRKSALALSQSMVTGQNKAVDTADQVNLDTASKLMDVSTGIRNQAISNASSASGMASSRATQGANNRAQAQQQNTQMAATVVSIGVMI